MTKKPNIILIMTDQQRADMRKSRGYALDTMPFLDDWAKEGVDFSSAFATNPTCTPSRVSMLTGRYSQSHKVRTNHNVRDAVYTEDLFDVVKRLGYKTALCGKNHSHRKASDFDYTAETGHLGYEGEINNTPEEVDFANFLRSTKHNEVAKPAPHGVEVQHPYRNVTSALEFIDDTNNPFCMWVSFAEPHNPFQVSKPYYDMFPPDSLPPLHTSEKELISKGEKFQWMRDAWEEVLGEEIDERIQRARSNYHGMLRLIDDQFKRLINGLEERNLKEDTIVVYMSDHGEFMGEYGLLRKGPELPDILCRVPFIWNGKGITKVGLDNEHRVSLADILPTLCDILGVDIPFGVQGKSLLPILKDENIPHEEFEVAYSESGFSGHYWNKQDKLTAQEEGAISKEKDSLDELNTWTQAGQVRSIWKGKYHLQMDMMETGYLYDLSKDPYEKENLWNSTNEEVQEIKVDMLTEMVSQMLKHTDTLPAPHHRYRTKIHPKGYWKQEFIAEDPGVRKD